MKLTIKKFDSRHGNEFCLIKSIERYRELTKEAIQNKKPNQARKESIRLVTAIKELIRHRNYYASILDRHGYNSHTCILIPPYYNCRQAYSIRQALAPIDNWLSEQKIIVPGITQPLVI